MARKNNVIEIEIIDTIFPNKSIGKYEGKTIMFKGGIKGQKVKVLLNRKKKDNMEGKLIEVLERSPLEKNISCFYVKDCGGCAYQTLLYEDELKLKEEQVLALFQKEDIKDINYLGIEGSPKVEGYRNKMEYTFSDEKKGGPLVLGLHKRGRFYEVVDTDGCSIADKDFTIIRRNVMKYFRGANTAYYNKRIHEGILRHLVIRKALSTGEILANLVTTSQGTVDTNNFIKALLKIDDLDGKIVGILHTINDGLADIVRADEFSLLYGRDYIIEEILGLKFKISPFSFFQTNTFGAEKLYSIVREFVGDEKNNIVFDLYSGTGTIAQILSPICEKVIGIEIVEEAVKMAYENTKINGLNNVKFIPGDVLKEVENLKEKPDLIIIDPPRDGIHPKAINKIIDFNPETFIYVSCNPITLVRDLKMFMDRGYKIDKMKLMDMFPRTPHVEVIVKLEKL
ncbi:23S rRNA (uracil(1939)-C(5))-methyltransferase RlmD [Clostridium sp. Cult2]|uniref:23S rRNA (uracil(1939)-C(5))-methyltransferase RlmD n=1 Tax=Clostridium sp. Cult2 TaxID=2079003 RepID=UPI001F0184EC|nr:23S rRNA (uracil(1939)-C(5))-methyltransferase RlmD [Clostridium sp. Cult2]MCF6466720.1 23S rRNA (uracil(1939)-C(5))-methyltransferase RlmD [Clostridium sp. Cult2]